MAQRDSKNLLVIFVWLHVKTYSGVSYRLPSCLGIATECTKPSSKELVLLVILLVAVHHDQYELVAT